MKSALPIIDWYLQHKRDLPWRHTQNPYFIWLSEVIMQQTRVEQGLPYYQKFVLAYPTVKKLAAANDDDVMKLWQGLGYYNRAKNMLATARIIATELKGIFPKNYNGLIQLKGIGPYTAAAVASFAYNEPKAVVDGNVYRVLSRLFNISEPINGTKGKLLFAQLAEEVLNTEHANLHNQAVMELGATVCKPTSPLCGNCPLRLQCLAYQHKTIAQLPVKLKKQKPKERYLHFFFVEDAGHTYIKQRSNERIWHNLHEPPFIESETPLNEQQLFALASTQLFAIDTKAKVFSTKHQLTHQTIYADFWVVKPSKKAILNADFKKVKISSLHTFAVHRLFDKFLDYYQTK
jgi:A/G-specific adenine glycosylase